MIYLDNRVGSGDLAYYFKKWHTPHEVGRLAFADVAFTGRGPDGAEMHIGIEIKKVRDALSCIADGRFAGHQLPGLLKDYHHVWLAIEGAYGVDQNTGLLVVQKKRVEPLTLGTRRFMYRDLSNWLATMEIKAGVRVRRTLNRVETARFCVDLHSWWNNKSWDQHRAHLAFDEQPLNIAVPLMRPNLVRLLAKELGGVGWVKSGAVARAFKTPMEMVLADERQWAAIDGIGKVLAKRIVESLSK